MANIASSGRENDKGRSFLHRLLETGTISNSSDPDGHLAKILDGLAKGGDTIGLEIMTKKGIKYATNLDALNEYKGRLDESPLLKVLAADDALATEAFTKIDDLDKETLRELLTWSVTNGKEKWVPMLMGQVELSASQQLDLLKLAISRKREQTIRDLLSRNAQNAWPEADGPMAIWLYRNEHQDFIRYVFPILHEKGVDLSAVDRNDSSLFWHARKAEDKATTDLLTQLGVKDVRSKARAAADARDAINAGKMDELRYLASIGAFPDSPMNAQPERPLVIAASRGNDAAVDILLGMKVPIGMDAVKAAAENKHGQLSNRLLGLIIEGRVPVVAEKITPDDVKAIGGSAQAIRLDPTQRNASPTTATAPKALAPVAPITDSASKSLAPAGSATDAKPKALTPVQQSPQTSIPATPERQTPQSISNTKSAPAAEPLPVKRAISSVPVSPVTEATEKVYLSEENSQTEHPLEGKLQWEFVERNGFDSLQATVEFPQRDLILYFVIEPTKNHPGEYTIYARFPAPDAPTAVPVTGAPGIILLKPDYNSDGDALQVTPRKPDGSGQFEFVLPSDPSIYRRNFSLLAERDWIEILISYANGERAFITFNKGETGAAAFVKAFEKWSSRTIQEPVRRKNFDVAPPLPPANAAADIVDHALRQSGVDLGAIAQEMSQPPQYEDPAVERVRLRALVQLRLNYLGLNAGTINGNYGPQTRKAIARFQKMLGREVTGKITVDEIKILYAFADETGPTETFRQFKKLKKNREDF